MIILPIATLNLLALSLISNAETKSTCQKMFGNNSSLTYEPIESNRGVIVTHSIMGTHDIKRKPGVPIPRGFRCAIIDLEDTLKVCPAGMEVDKKRNGRPICLSKEFPIKELCPTEINDGWPGLSEKICKPKK